MPRIINGTVDELSEMVTAICTAVIKTAEIKAPIISKYSAAVIKGRKTIQNAGLA